MLAKEEMEDSLRKKNDSRLWEEYLSVTIKYHKADILF